MRKEIKCPIDGLTYNKETKCPNYSCNNCPGNKPSKTKQNILATPANFSKAYLQYLTGETTLKMPDGKTLPPIFTLTNNYHLYKTNSNNKEAYKTVIEAGISEVLKYLSKDIKKKLNKIDSDVKNRILIALSDLTDTTIMQYKGLRKIAKKCTSEREKHLEAVNIVLNLPILKPQEHQVLSQLKSTLEDLSKPVEYTPFFDLNLHTMQNFSEGRNYFSEEYWLNHDLYLVTHKNIKPPPNTTKPYLFFKNALQEVILQLLIKGGQKKEEAIDSTVALINDYLKSYLSGKFQAIKITRKTVENLPKLS